jgi:hypothetical protein
MRTAFESFCAPVIWVHQRRERRVACRGNVQITLESACRSNGKLVGGELMDVSAHGFRVRHQGLKLRPGTVVRFEHPFLVGRARVAWTSMLAGRPQSGFQVLAS